MNRDGEVRKWTYDIPESELRPEQITPDTIENFSPLPKPPLSRKRVAQVLIGRQNHAIQSSFRSMLPKGAFHDTVIDARTGQELEVPGIVAIFAKNTFGSVAPGQAAAVRRCSSTPQKRRQMLECAA